jgi:hypothetical protein
VLRLKRVLMAILAGKGVDLPMSRTGRRCGWWIRFVRQAFARHAGG